MYVLICPCCCVRLVGSLETGIPCSYTCESVCLPLGSSSVYLEGESVILLGLDPLLLVLLKLEEERKEVGRKEESGRGIEVRRGKDREREKKKEIESEGLGKREGVGEIG